jgi:hypothetical protein
MGWTSRTANRTLAGLERQRTFCKTVSTFRDLRPRPGSASREVLGPDDYGSSQNHENRRSSHI